MVRWRLSPARVSRGFGIQLVANACKPVDRSGLIERLTADVEAFDPHRLDMLVYRLRRKCEQASTHPLPLRAVRGVGYMIDW